MEATIIYWGFRDQYSVGLGVRLRVWRVQRSGGLELRNRESRVVRFGCSNCSWAVLWGWLLERCIGIVREIHDDFARV